MVLVARYVLGRSVLAPPPQLMADPDRQRLHQTHTVDGPLDLVGHDLDFISQQAPSATVDAVADLTDQRFDLFTPYLTRD